MTNNNRLTIMSVFDGISCGQIALERAGIEINKYYASEIKKYAIKVTQEHYPNTIQLGDITKIDFKKFEGEIDLLLGGSPCQNLSNARSSHCNIKDGLKGTKSKLFYEFYRCLTEITPTYFLFENVLMDKNDENIITDLLKVTPIQINSNLVSFQNRKRLYWTNIPNITIPLDKNINFQHFKDTNTTYCDKFIVKKTPSRLKMWGNGEGECPNITYKTKINCITKNQDRWKNSGLIEYKDFCRYLTTNELEIAQTLPKGYTSCLSKRQSEDVIGDGWTVDIIVHIFKGLK